MLDRETLRLTFRLRRTVVHAALQFLDFSGERPAQRHVQFLNAPADRQHRHAFFNGGADQRQRRRIAGIVIGLESRTWLNTVESRVDVRFRAGDQYAIHSVENGVEVHLVAKTWHQKRCDLRDFDGRSQILIRCCVPGVILERFDVGWYGNQGAGLRHSTSIR